MEEIRGKVLGIENYFSGKALDGQVLRIETRPFSYKAGQYMMVSEDSFRLRADPSKLKWTSYSIASSPAEKGILEFVYSIKYTGGFTQYLAENLREGMFLNLKGPLGSFVLEGNGKGKVFVATGAGIAPIMGMIRTLEIGGFPSRARLFFGFRNQGQYFYRKYLENLENRNFKMETIASKYPGWKGENGHVQKLIERASFSPGEEEVYICGNPAMVKEVREFFIGKGFEKGDVRIEQF